VGTLPSLDKAPAPRADGQLLSIEDLRVHFQTDAGKVRAVNGISWQIRPQETLGIVGESGSGKSVSAMAVMGLIPTPPGSIPSGRIVFRGQDLLTLSHKQLRLLRGREISMISQDPMTALNPVFKVGHQIAEVIRAHQKTDRRSARRRSVDLLAEVGIPNAARRAEEYPHQFSGGMRQRALIAMALALDPVLLLADEPTTALDVTIQAQIMELLASLQAERGTSIVLITHDLGLVAGHADRVLVMYAGRVVETALTQDLYSSPRHAYTLGLLRSLARLDEGRADRLTSIPGQPPSLMRVPSGCAFHPRCPFATAVCREEVPALLIQDGSGHMAACHHSDQVAANVVEALTVGETVARADLRTRIDGMPRPGTPASVAATPAVAERLVRSGPLVSVNNLVKHYPGARGIAFPRRSRMVHAVDGISFDIAAGETLALVGESGCGKSTAGRTLLRLIEPTSGTIQFDGRDITTLPQNQLRLLRRQAQIVFQDPYASLNPRLTVRGTLRESFRIHGIDEGKRVSELLDLVGLAPEHAARYPHEFSGGQRQRVGIARAISLNPQFVVCDEPVSALDVSIQAQIVNLLEDLQQELQLTYLFIAHDLSVVRHVADRVAVMYLGRIVEIADQETLFKGPAHPYTQALISAVPIPDPVKERKRRRILLTGDTPSPTNLPGGCRFRTRCWKFANELSDPERAKCVEEPPRLLDSGLGHLAACHYPELQQFVL
jgi:peptide/nickel transport system ATP-binding protein